MKKIKCCEYIPWSMKFTNLFSGALSIIQETNKKCARSHRHLSNIDGLTARTDCLVCFMSTLNGRIKKE
jgi:hypothetical protein